MGAARVEVVEVVLLDALLDLRALSFSTPLRDSLQSEYSDA